MAKQKGFFSLVTGMIIGAAATYLSSEKNRQKTQKAISTATAKVKKAEVEYKKDPTAFKKKALAKSKKVVRSAIAKTKKLSTTNKKIKAKKS